MNISRYPSIFDDNNKSPLVKGRIEDESYDREIDRTCRKTF